MFFVQKREKLKLGFERFWKMDQNNAIFAIFLRKFSKFSKILRRPGASPPTPYEARYNIESPKFFPAYATV